MTSSRGNNARGIKDVTGIGIASVAHQQTISIAIAATVQAVSFKPDGAGSSKINKNIANDKKYGCKEFNTRLKHSGIKRLGLHSSEISFFDLENKINTFVADYDDQFEKMLNYLNT